MCPMHNTPHNTPPAKTSEKPEHPDHDRLSAAQAWAAARLGLASVRLSPIAPDASLRRYFRLHTDTGSLVLMDAPAEFEHSAPFLDIAGRLRAAGLHAPEILHFDLEQGFGLLEDLGDLPYSDILTAATADGHFADLFHVLTQMALAVDCHGLPEYGHELVQAELDLFTDWYLLRHKHRRLSLAQERIWQALCNELRRSAAGQPQVFVHRDFHSNNLLYREGGKPGIIDFQDAVRGPISYDFVSLLWDRYIAWPRPRLEKWMETYRSLLTLDMEPAAWIRCCDLMGLQRNLKIVGIFARLHYRDHKPGYVRMIPQFYRYLLDVLPLYPEFHAFADVLEQVECAP